MEKKAKRRLRLGIQINTYLNLISKYNLHKATEESIV